MRGYLYVLCLKLDTFIYICAKKKKYWRIFNQRRECSFSVASLVAATLLLSRYVIGSVRRNEQVLAERFSLIGMRDEIILTPTTLLINCLKKRDRKQLSSLLVMKSNINSTVLPPIKSLL